MVIAIVNQKGGTGKTTTSINLSTALTKMGKKVLLIGMDMQGDLAYSMGIEPNGASMSDVLLEKNPISSILVQREGFDVAPAGIDLADAELELYDTDDREYRLKSKISSCKNKYDYIIIDCSPSLSLLAVNALTAADKIIIPIQLSVLSVNGLELMLNTVKKIKKVLNPDLRILGVLPVMVDFRKKLSREILQYLNDEFDFYVFKNVIATNVRASEAPSFGQSVIEYAPDSKSAVNYMKVAKEILELN